MAIEENKVSKEEIKKEVNKTTKKEVNLKETLKPWGVAVLRWGLAIVFLYFGISQLMYPERFVGWLPAEVAMIPLAPKIIVILNGALELLFGTALALGLYTRIAAFILGSHLAGITYTIGLTEIGFRDLGLSIATLALVLTGPGALSLSTYLEKYDSSQEQIVQ